MQPQILGSESASPISIPAESTLLVQAGLQFPASSAAQPAQPAEPHFVKLSSLCPFLSVQETFENGTFLVYNPTTEEQTFNWKAHHLHSDEQDPLHTQPTSTQAGPAPPALCPLPSAPPPTTGKELAPVYVIGNEAAGDTINDCDYLQTPINDAFNECIADMGNRPGTIWVRSGSYEIDNVLDFPYGSLVQGEGKDNTILYSQDGQIIEQTSNATFKDLQFRPNQGTVINAELIEIQGATVTFQDCKFDGLEEPGLSQFLLMTFGAKVTLQNCELFNLTNNERAIHYNTTTGKLTLESCWIENVYRCFQLINNARDTNLKNCQFLDIFDGLISGATIEELTMESCKYIQSDQPSVMITCDQLRNSRVESNDLYFYDDNGSRAISTAEWLRNTKINNNTFRAKNGSTFIGHYLFLDGAIFDNEISNNFFFDYTYIPIYFIGQFRGNKFCENKFVESNQKTNPETVRFFTVIENSQILDNEIPGQLLGTSISRCLLNDNIFGADIRGTYSLTNTGFIDLAGTAESEICNNKFYHGLLADASNAWSIRIGTNTGGLICCENNTTAQNTDLGNGIWININQISKVNDNYFENLDIGIQITQNARMSKVNDNIFQNVNQPIVFFFNDQTAVQANNNSIHGPNSNAGILFNLASECAIQANDNQIYQKLVGIQILSPPGEEAFYFITNNNQFYGMVGTAIDVNGMTGGSIGNIEGNQAIALAATPNAYNVASISGAAQLTFNGNHQTGYLPAWTIAAPPAIVTAPIDAIPSGVPTTGDVNL
jgi:hypothetical protein